jgi:crotonobetainyl-CoA:carnitine CoA-transferase CaiB-like acyl-CoA transferase
MSHWLSRAPAGSAPLAGVRVLDFSELLPGPFMTQSMAELGADVLKVERPPHGDPVRRSAPSLYAAVNRDKRIMMADLKQDAARAEVLALAAQADVLVEAYRPGVMDRLGMGWDALHESYPRLIYVSLSGYGRDGPWAQRPGHDINYLAAAGIVALATKDAAPSASFGVPMADLNGAIYALAAVNAALFQREHNGRGQRLDVSLAESSLHGINPRLAMFHQLKANTLAEQRHIAQRRPGYGTFECRHGQWLTLGALEDHFWQALLHALDLPSLARDDLRHYAQRHVQSDGINSTIAQALMKLDRSEAIQRLVAADVPVAEVCMPAELATHPQWAARQLMVDTPGGPQVRFPVQMDRTGQGPVTSEP